MTRSGIRSGLAAAVLPLAGCARGVLDPAGPVARGERTILLDSLAIMLAIVIPTITATLAFAFWYSAKNTRAAYDPDFEYSGRIELVTWSIPAMTVLLLAGVAWIGSHAYDPFKPLESKAPPVQVQVVALDWKWLFIYPQEGVASVDRLVVPAGRPIDFQITSATVMNSFLVPQLGGQIYAMPGMTSRLSLQADAPGEFRGLSAHYSGDGFAHMGFPVQAKSEGDYRAWIAAAHAAPPLDDAAYGVLAQRSTTKAPQAFGAPAPGLFQRITAGQAPPPQAAPVAPGGRAKAET